MQVQSAIEITGLNKVYDNGFRALRNVNLTVRHGEIFALLGPNGAGKTTLIGITCGLVNASSGDVKVAGHDVVADYRLTRSKIGLVPQELTTDAFETVWATLRFSRRLFGKPANNAHLEKVLKTLSLWDKKDDQVRKLSGGMKRRLLIAKALSHEPEVLFLDEPTAGVDVELRRSMWQVIEKLRETGVTIILTTHYIEEAEAMADRVGIIRNGEILLVEDKAALMDKLGQKTLTIELSTSLTKLPAALADYDLELANNGQQLRYVYLPQKDQNRVPQLLKDLMAANISYSDLHTQQSTLEDIFVDLVHQDAV